MRDFLEAFALTTTVIPSRWAYLVSLSTVDYSKSSLARLKRTKAGASVETYFCDLVEIDTLTPLAQQIVSEMGAPRALVNNAGISLYADITELTDGT